jgi:uncharacterized protein YjiS (DUF1127 family)
MQLKDLTQAVAATFGTWREYRDMANELSRLPDHALADFGTTRWEIREFALRCAKRDAEQINSRLSKEPGQ